MTGQGRKQSRRIAAVARRGPVVLATALVLALSFGAPASAQLFGSRQSNDAQLITRIDQLEAQIRTLTGQVEQYEHRIRVLEDSLRRFQQDTEYRFQELGAKGSDKARAPGAAVLPPPRPMPAPTARTLSPPPTYGAIGQPSPLTGPGQPQTYGGIKPLGPPPGQGYPTGAAPLDISPPSLGGTAPTEQPGAGGNPANVALAVPTDAQTVYDVAYAFVLQRDYEAAQSAFADFVKRYPNDKLVPNAQYWLGESYYAQGQYHDAADAFLTVYRSYKSSGKAPEALLKLAMSLQQLGEKEAACASYAEFGYAEFGRTFPKASSELKKRVSAERKGAGC